MNWRLTSRSTPQNIHKHGERNTDGEKTYLIKLESHGYLEIFSLGNGEHFVSASPDKSPLHTQKTGNEIGYS